MKKKLLIISFLFLFIGLIGCKEEKTGLDAPTNIVVSGDLLSFDKVEGATSYRIDFVSKTNGNSSKRITSENSIDLTSFNLNYDTYNIYVQAIGNNVESEYSKDIVEYVLEELNVMKKFDGDNLVNNTYVKWMGRTLYNSDSKLNIIFHSASGFEVYFYGTTVKASLYATNYNIASKMPYVVVVVDDDYNNAKRIALTKQTTDFTLVEFASNDEQKHKVSLYKSTESIDSHIGVYSIETDGKFVEEMDIKERKIEVIAASSSTGYGNLGSSGETKTSTNSDCMRGFAVLTAKNLNADLNIYSASGWGAKASLYTSPNSLNVFDAYKKVDFFNETKWDFTTYTPDVVVINLGTNDWSYINAASSATEKEKRLIDFKNQYVSFLQFINSAYPNAKIIMLYGLMNEVNVYDATIEIYNTAKELIPSLAITKINGDGKGCNSHPSAASHQVIANKLTEVIKNEMGW